MIISLGYKQHVYAANVPHQYDGQTDNHGPIATGCWPHG